MKDRLTPEQSQRLIELGVDPSKASFTRLDFNGTYAYISGERVDTVRACVNAEYYVEECEIFTLSDILSLLPRELCERRDGIRYDCHLSMYGYNETWGAMYRLDNGDDFLEVFESPELIDALFELLVWCITNKHLEL